MPETEMNDQSQQQRAAEDGPEYRSVMVSSSSSPILKPSFLPLEKVSKSPLVVENSRIVTSNVGSRRPSASSYRWEQKELPNLPIDYNLVRTNMHVKDSSAQVVADRICSELKSSSIVIDSKGCEEKNSLLAETHCGVKLVISLFAHDGMVVVEVRRRTGCSFQFRDAAKSILRSSKALGKQRPMTSRKFGLPPTLPKRSREAYHDCIRDDFRIAFNMLQSQKADAHLLALETMGKLTTISDASDVAAKMVLGNRECIKQLLTLLDVYSKGRPNPENEPSYRSTQCRRILEILANSCEEMSNSDLATILSTNDHSLKTRSFLSSLLSSLDEASTRPHDAFQAARCMRRLLISKEVENLLIEMSAIDAISSARSVGVKCHEQLEQESFKLMGQLQNVC